ncbi:MAG: ABC transporter ATP-binding protein [Clostridiales bacterium]|nr:ABC transporter ATP-binding protein [Clostridiales bacterium]
MIRMFRELKGSYRFVALIFLLLFGQAFCDLALPSYTSDIINVGVQQGGIADSVPEEIREESMNQLFLFMEEKEKQRVEEFFELKDGVYTHGKLTKEEREELNGIFSVPMVSVSSLKDEKTAGEMREKMQLPENTDLLQMIGELPEEQKVQMLSEMTDKLTQMPESITTQGAVLYLKNEYREMGKDLDRIQMGYVLNAGIKMLLLAAVIMTASILVTFFSSRVAAKLGHDLRNKVYGKVISFSSSEMNHFSTASLITRSTNDIQQVQMVFTMLFRIVLYAPILGVGGVLKVLKTESSMTWILGIAVALILAVVGVLFAAAMPKFKLLQTLIDKLNLVSREILTGIPVIRAFSREKHEEERFEEANARLTKTNLFVNRTMTLMMPVMMLIMNGISVLIIYNGAHSIDSGNMQVGDMMAFIQYAMQIIMSFLMITMISIMLPRAGVAANRIGEILDTETAIRNPEKTETPKEGEKGQVEFDHVSFSYPGAEEEILTDISFTAKKGETVAFIGSTGSGKSTLINLIPRFFDVTAGAVRVDGLDVRNMDLKDLRNRIGYVPQKGILFSGTIDSNLRYGKEDASPAEIEKAAEIAQALDFIRQKEEGLESPIAQGGSNVSGGQKQRLSIARAIAKQPEIYIFDDSFSALDYKTDVALRKALKEETKEATTLIVAQRISTIIHADRILVLDEGHIAGMGTHKELLKSCEVYQQIARSQLSEEELGNE